MGRLQRWRKKRRGSCVYEEGRVDQGRAKKVVGEVREEAGKVEDEEENQGGREGFGCNEGGGEGKGR